jgi:rhodanese-related sulfurtransferase
MRSLRQAFLILLAALVSAGVSALVHPRRPPWSEDALLPGEVTLKTVLAWGPKVLWVDARSQNEYQAEHVPNAILLNLEDWDRLFPRFLDRWSPDQKIVVYCSASSCQLSHEVAKRLEQSGVSPVYVLKGGWERWKGAR